MEDNKDFPIHYQTFTTQLQSMLNQTEPFVTVSRAATRLKSIFTTLQTYNILFVTPEKLQLGRRSWNHVYSPAALNQGDK